MTRHELDHYLVKLADLVLKGQQSDPDFYGMVGACVIDPDHNVVASTSTSKGNKWIHAERNALNKYKQQFGDVPEDSIVVTTLSPCNEHMHNRYGSSCTDIITNTNIRKVYCGYIDPTQHDHHNEGFVTVETDNKHIKNLCKNLADTFLK